jgi:hypothetical protein
MSDPIQLPGASERQERDMRPTMTRGAPHAARFVRDGSGHGRFTRPSGAFWPMGGHALRLRQLPSARPDVIQPPAP